MVRESSNTKRKINTIIDIPTILLDIRKSFFLILTLSISVSLFSYIVKQEMYIPNYRMEATYLVTSRGINNDLLSNMNTASKMASRFAQIIGSSTLKKQVADDLDISIEQISIGANLVEETNLITLSVTAETPLLAYRIFNSVTTNLPTLTEYLISNAVLTVLVSPSVPTRAVNLINPSRTMSKVFVLSMLGLTFLCIVISTLRDTIRSGIDIEQKLNSDYLGGIYHERKPVKYYKQKKHKESLLITRKTISFRYTESLKKVCKRIENKMNRHGFKSLLVTSTFENEGKSTIAANLAITLADQGKKVILLDFDFRKPAQYEIFDLDKNEYVHLSEVFIGNYELDSIIGILEKENVYTIFNSVPNKKSTELITPVKLNEIINCLKERFDYIIIDSSPMALVADAEVIASAVDATVLVVKEHMASSSEINDVLDTLDSCSSKMIGCIINDTRGSAGIGMGGRGYGRYYGYGYTPYDGDGYYKRDFYVNSTKSSESGENNE